MNKIDDSFIEYAGDILANTEAGFSGSKIVKLCNEYALRFNRFIPYAKTPLMDANKRPVTKRTALKENLRSFDLREQLQIIKEMCNAPEMLSRPEVQQMKLRMLMRYRKDFDETLMSELNLVTARLPNVGQLLQPYPKSLKLFQEAQLKYEHGLFDRNVLDDMRLAFELLVKDLFEKNSSLENQKGIIAKGLESAGASIGLRNLFMTLYSTYLDYQNKNVKHDDLVNKVDVKFVVDITMLMMEYLLKTKG